MSEMMRTTVDTPAEVLTRTFTPRRKREALGERVTLVFDSVLLSCLYSIGNQTSGSPLEDPIREAFGGEAAARCFGEWIATVIEINRAWFGRLGEAAAEEVVRTGKTELPKEIRAFAEGLRTIEGVESLLARVTKGGFETWVLVNNPSGDSLYEIYEVEWNLMAAFPGVPFDFHVIDRRDREPSSVATFDEQTVWVPLTGYSDVW